MFKTILNTFASYLRHPKIFIFVLFYLSIQVLFSIYVLDYFFGLIDSGKFVFAMSQDPFAFISLNNDFFMYVIAILFVYLFMNTFFLYMFSRLAKDLPLQAHLLESFFATLRAPFQMFLVTFFNLMFILFTFIFMFYLLFANNILLQVGLIFVYLIVFAYVEIYFMVLTFFMAYNSSKMNDALRVASIFTSKHLLAITAIGLFSITVLLVSGGLLDFIQDDLLFIVLYMLVFGFVYMLNPVLFSLIAREDEQKAKLKS